MLLYISLGLSALFCFLFLHPFLIYPLTLRFLPNRPLNLRRDSHSPSATLVFCAYNERGSVDAKIANLQAIKQRVPSLKFACYVDLSTDGTLEALQKHRSWIDVHAATARTGKAVGMSRLAAAATTEIMIFTDANVIVEPESVPKLLAYFSDPTVGGVCGKLIYTNADETHTAETSSAYWRLEESIKRLESQKGSTMGADGSLFAARLDSYPKVPSHLLDDFIVSMSVIFSGRRLVSAPDVLAYERAATGSTDEYNRKRRIACRAYSSHLHIWPLVRALTPRDIYMYVSHRVIRWYSAFWLAGAALFGLMGALALFDPLAVLASATILVAGFRIAALCGLPGFAHVHEALGLFYATARGLLDSWRGRTYQTWQPAASRGGAHSSLAA